MQLLHTLTYLAITNVSMALDYWYYFVTGKSLWEEHKETFEPLYLLISNILTINIASLMLYVLIVHLKFRPTVTNLSLLTYIVFRMYLTVVIEETSRQLALRISIKSALQYSIPMAILETIYTLHMKSAYTLPLFLTTIIANLSLALMLIGLQYLSIKIWRQSYPGYRWAIILHSIYDSFVWSY